MTTHTNNFYKLKSIKLIVTNLDKIEQSLTLFKGIHTHKKNLEAKQIDKKCKENKG